MFEALAVRVHEESLGMAYENSCTQATDRYPSGEDNPNKWVYIKVKREKSTYFLHIDLSETIGEVKAKLQELVEKVTSSSASFCVGSRILQVYSEHPECCRCNGKALATQYSLN